MGSLRRTLFRPARPRFLRGRSCFVGTPMCYYILRFAGSLTTLLAGHHVAGLLFCWIGPDCAGADEIPPGLYAVVGGRICCF